MATKKTPQSRRFFQVEVTGFEPATSASRTQRSTKLSHTSLFIKLYNNTKNFRKCQSFKTTKNTSLFLRSKT